MRYDEMAGNYYRWLLDMVHFREYGHYERVLRYLFSREFYWLDAVPMDRNRYDDGLALREDFTMERGYPRFFWRGYLPDYCTVLEMMAALARSCEDRLMGDPTLGDRTHVWFWVMMNKLGLDNMTDEQFNEAHAERIVNKVLDRTFSQNGRGGLFGQLRRHGDMRDVEWWYQMNYYFMEYHQF